MLMPGEHQPTLPELEALVPPELLDPARRAAPPGTTPAERAVVSEHGVAAPAQTVPVQPTTPFGTTPTTPPDKPLP
jgi:hypothetical protein